MGNLIAQDGVQKLAIAVFNDEYGTGLRDTIVKTASAAGVDIIYGEKDTFDPTETNFSSIATAIKASNPDATLVIAFDQTKPLLKALASRRSQHQEAVLRGRQHLRLFQRTRRGPAGRLEGAPSRVSIRPTTSSSASNPPAST